MNWAMSSGVGSAITKIAAVVALIVISATGVTIPAHAIPGFVDTSGRPVPLDDPPTDPNDPRCLQWPGWAACQGGPYAHDGTSRLDECSVNPNGPDCAELPPPYGPTPPIGTPPHPAGPPNDAPPPPVAPPSNAPPPLVTAPSDAPLAPAGPQAGTTEPSLGGTVPSPSNAGGSMDGGIGSGGGMGAGGDIGGGGGMGAGGMGAGG